MQYFLHAVLYGTVGSYAYFKGEKLITKWPNMIHLFEVISLSQRQPNLLTLYQSFLL